MCRQLSRGDWQYQAISRALCSGRANACCMPQENTSAPACPESLATVPPPPRCQSHTGAPAARPWSKSSTGAVASSGGRHSTENGSVPCGGLSGVSLPGHPAPQHWRGFAHESSGLEGSAGPSVSRQPPRARGMPLAVITIPRHAYNADTLNICWTPTTVDSPQFKRVPCAFRRSLVACSPLLMELLHSLLRGHHKPRPPAIKYSELSSTLKPFQTAICIIVTLCASCKSKHKMPISVGL